jgi:hypothetical protein
MRGFFIFCTTPPNNSLKHILGLFFD